MKKLIAMLLVTGVLISGVIGCGGATSTKATTPAATDKDKDKDKDKKMP